MSEIVTDQNMLGYAGISTKAMVTSLKVMEEIFHSKACLAGYDRSKKVILIRDIFSGIYAISINGSPFKRWSKHEPLSRRLISEYGNIA